jgi:hypothetical protein
MLPTTVLDFSAKNSPARLQLSDRCAIPARVALQHLYSGFDGFASQLVTELVDIL